MYLADRIILIDQPKDGFFAAFGEQAPAEDERRHDIFTAFPQDFFDLVIVDECHSGSARDEGAWRAILDHFEPEYQLGMTATRLRDHTRDSHEYFGNPLYTYNLRQGIEDGFLAPYRVHRVITERDAVGWRPSQDELDRYAREILQTGGKKRHRIRRLERRLE